jgi:ABC-type hemin transport system ATPase subunit
LPGERPFPTMGGMLIVDGVTKRYGETLALDSCSFRVDPGRMVGFLGPNGAGKTTATAGTVAEQQCSSVWASTGVHGSERHPRGQGRPATRARAEPRRYRWVPLPTMTAKI